MNRGTMLNPTIQPLPRATPEEHGVASQAILAFIDALEAAGLNPHSFMLLRHGQVIAEAYWAPYHAGCKRFVYSLSKSFTSTAVGLAVSEGRLSVDDPVVSFFPADLPPQVSANLAAMRVRHLLSMTSGHAIDTSTILHPGLDNWVKAILAVPVEFTPGEHFLYNSGASYLLSAIVQKVTGQSVLSYLTPRLFEPLGIWGATWETCPRGVNTGGWGLSVKTDDLARFGLLYLREGLWNGRRVLPAEWIAQATALQVRNDGAYRAAEPLDWRQGYGFQFWRCQHGAYRGDGAAGQYCIVMPAQDAVLVYTSETSVMQGMLDQVWRLILPAMQPEPLSADPAAQERLNRRIAALGVPLPSAVPAPAELIAQVNGRRFELRENRAGLQAAALAFGAQCLTLRLWDAAGEHALDFDLSAWTLGQDLSPDLLTGVPRLMFGMATQKPFAVATRATWADARSCVLTAQLLDTPHRLTLTCRLSERTLDLHAASSAADPLSDARDTTFQGELKA